MTDGGGGGGDHNKRFGSLMLCTQTHTYTHARTLNIYIITIIIILMLLCIHHTERDTKFACADLVFHTTTKCKRKVFILILANSRAAPGYSRTETARLYQPIWQIEMILVAM